MMTLKLQIVIAIAILAILAVLVNMIRKRSLELKYALVWMMVLAALLIFDCAPVLLNIVSNFLGIYAPTSVAAILKFLGPNALIFHTMSPTVSHPFTLVNAAQFRIA